MITLVRFITLTNIVIDNFEGGYYHPDMLKTMKPSDRALLEKSGETMFGLDRKNGTALAMYPEWKQFWDIIDKAQQKNNWKHYGLGGKHSALLKDLAGRIMYRWFNRLAKKYLFKSSMEKINADDRLLIHFSYASWNGEGWFKKFAAALNKARGTKEEIYVAAMEARVWASSKAIRTAGIKMVKLIKTLPVFYTI